MDLLKQHSPTYAAQPHKFICNKKKKIMLIYIFILGKCCIYECCYLYFGEETKKLSNQRKQAVQVRDLSIDSFTP